MRRLLAPIFLAAAVAGCSSLGSHQADAARASDVGTTAGAVVSTIPGATVVGTVTSPLTDLAAREAQRRIDATPEGEPLSLLTQILIAIGAFGGVFTTLKTATRSVVAKATDAAATAAPPPKT